MSSQDKFKWFHFMDMHSGGGQSNPPYNHIYVEAVDEPEAVEIFTAKFSDPSHISCECCGEDYAITIIDRDECSDGDDSKMIHHPETQGTQE